MIVTRKIVGGFGKRARRFPIAIHTVHRDDCRMLSPRTPSHPMPPAGTANVRDCRVCKPVHKEMEA